MTSCSSSGDLNIKGRELGVCVCVCGGGGGGSIEDAITELRSCVKLEVDVLGSPSPICLMVSVDIKQHLKKKNSKTALQSSGAV